MAPLGRPRVLAISSPLIEPLYATRASTSIAACDSRACRTRPKTRSAGAGEFRQQGQGVTGAAALDRVRTRVAPVLLVQIASQLVDFGGAATPRICTAICWLVSGSFSGWPTKSIASTMLAE